MGRCERAGDGVDLLAAPALVLFECGGEGIQLLLPLTDGTGHSFIGLKRFNAQLIGPAEGAVLGQRYLL